MGHPPLQISRLLLQWGEGEREALDQVVPLVYDRLCELARARIRRGSPDQSLRTGSLVHEAYLKLAASSGEQVRDRAHFLALAARVMRQVLVDHARARIAGKRGGGATAIALNEALWVGDDDADSYVDLDDALARFEALDPRRSRMVEQRYFGGLSLEEIAEASACSLATVKRDLRVARAWLASELQDRRHES